jgi:dihydroxyacetone kinase
MGPGALHRVCVRGRNLRHEIARLPDLGRGVIVIEATEESRRLGALAVLAMEAASRTLLAHEKDLGSLDAVAGDGDHGVSMSRGAEGALAAARAALVQGAGVRDALLAAGQEWSERAGGTSGALWSSGLTRLGSSLGDKDAYSASDLVEAVGAAEQAVKALGGAEVGDKTLVDALHPFVERLKAEVESGCTLALAIKAAAQDATRAAEATAPLRPKKGRARPLAERSIGRPDPGAVSFALVMSAIAEEVALWAGDVPRLGGGEAQ